MRQQAYAYYKPANNTLEIIRPGETVTRIIRCTNLNPQADKVHGVEVNGDEVVVYVGPHNNPRPSHTRIYSMMSLSGGRRGSL